MQSSDPKFHEIKHFAGFSFIVIGIEEMLFGFGDN